MSFAKFKPRAAKEYTGVNPSKARETVVCIVDTRSMTVTPIEKMRPVRSEEYRRYVAAQPCFGCGIQGYSQAAHPNFGKGLGLKTSDIDCFPLCASRMGKLGCHDQHDQRVDVGRDESREIEVAYTLRMQRIARADGRPEFS